MPKGKAFNDLLPFGGNITKATVIRDGRNYLVSLAVEAVIDQKEPLRSVMPSRVISMDMGIARFCTYGNGSGQYERVNNPRWIRKHEKRLRRFQKAMSRKQYDVKTHTGSKNWEKARIRVAKEQRKVANQRKDFLHKLSRKIADSCDVFVCEDLAIRNMLKNRHLAKAISSVGWGTFLTYVKYKVERNGGIFIKVGRFYPSSKLCGCGYKNDSLKLSERFWVCPKCHTLHDRDAHAVDNIRTEGIRLLAEQGISVA